NGTAVYDAVAGTVTFTAEAGYTGPATFTYAVSDGRGGADEAIVSLNVLDAASISTLFQPGSQPTTASVNDANPIELGMRFHVTQNGSIAGIRFYKGAQNTGTHVGKLWTADG